MARGPSPRDDASRRGKERSDRGWEEEEDAPWLDEGDYEDEGATHTLVGRSTLIWILGALAVLAIGVIVGILLVSKREDSPIDVPAVGEEVPVLKNTGNWKVAPAGEDVAGTPVEGQGQVLFGAGDGRDPQARIDFDALPEDPLDKPGSVAPADAEAEMANRPAPAPPKMILPEAQRPIPPEAVAVPKPAPAKSAPAKPLPAPAPATPTPSATGGSGASIQGASVQLGAFSSQARALAAFKSLSGRFSYLSGLEPNVVPTTRDGQTLYRLRANAGSSAAAKDICGRLRVAGEACTLIE